jgi:protein-histidine pros-kinase
MSVTKTESSNGAVERLPAGPPAIQTAHEALLASERYLRSVFDGAIDGMAVVDDRRRIVDVNPAFCTLFARSKRDLLGMTIDGLGVFRAEPDRLWRRFLRHGRSKGEGRIARPDGSVRSVEYTATASIVPSRHLGIVRDTTERAHAEVMLRRMATIVETSDDPIIACTVDDIIETWNRGATRLYGFEAEQMIGRSMESIVPLERRSELAFLRSRIERGEHVEHFETVRLRRDGSRVPVSLTVSPITGRLGRVIGTSSIARDMTERKRFESALREKNLELERANLAKDRFLAGMSHELRTPLNAVIGFAGTLLMRLPGPLNADQERQLRTVQASARHLLSLINELLDLAKIESGSIDFHPEPLPCQEIVAEVLDSLRPTAEGKGLSLVGEFPDGPVQLHSDRRAIRQILLNLVGNALKFTERGGIRVTLRDKRRRESGAVLFRVSDSGPGVAPSDMDRLFLPFRRLGGEPGVEGTGLGLYLSRNLARALGGDVLATSELGRGSTFTLSLKDST